MCSVPGIIATGQVQNGVVKKILTQIQILSEHVGEAA